MEPNNEGLVQMIFLFELDDFQVPDVDLLGSKQEQFELIYFWDGKKIMLSLLWVKWHGTLFCSNPIHPRENQHD